MKRTDRNGTRVQVQARSRPTDRPADLPEATNPTRTRTRTPTPTPHRTNTNTNTNPNNETGTKRTELQPSLRSLRDQPLPAPSWGCWRSRMEKLCCIYLRVRERVSHSWEYRVEFKPSHRPRDVGYSYRTRTQNPRCPNYNTGISGGQTYGRQHPHNPSTGHRCLPGASHHRRRRHRGDGVHFTEHVSEKALLVRV